MPYKQCRCCDLSCPHPRVGHAEFSGDQFLRIIPGEEALLLGLSWSPVMVRCRKDRLGEESFCSVCVEYQKDAVRPPKEV